MTDGPLILSVDTSLPVLSVALTHDASLIGGIMLIGKESRNEKLLPAIDWLLAESAVDQRALELLVVTRGPGSFTGVRVGLATVQGLAFALGIPVCAMSTHEALAESERGISSSCLVYSDAGRGEFYVSAFVDDVETIAPALMKREELDSLRPRYEDTIDVDARFDSLNVALLAARRGARILSIGLTEPYAAVTPIYVRLAEAEVKLREKTHERTGQD